MCVLAQIIIGRISYIMRKTRRLKKAATVAAVVAMTATMMPVGVLTNGFGVNKIAYADEQGVAQSKVLDTIWNESEVGEHEGKGSYAYDSASKTVTLTGAGTKFDKDAGKDNLYYAYFNAKGNITITAKMTVTGSTGMAGLLVRNASDEATSGSAALYADISKSQVRYGYHLDGGKGGASNVNSAVTTSSQDIYVKLEIAGDKATYHVASQPDFSDEKTKVQTITGLDAKTVGFFATEGVTATFSDVKVSSEYTQDDVAVKKTIFDSEVGELKTSNTTSKDYNDAGDMSYTETPDGNVLSVVADRGTIKKGNIRQDERINYMLFPSTTEDMTIKADITIKSINSGTDKQGIAVGQFAADATGKRACDTIHFHKGLKIQHTYSTTPGAGGTGSLANAYTVGSTYSLTYTKKENKAYLTVVDASGNVVSSTVGSTVDLTSGTYYEGLQSGKEVQYGLAFSGVEVDIANVTLLNSADEVVYDMNDYYIATGVAPVIANAASLVSEDRNSINLTWDIATEGSGNVKYIIYVSKDGSEYTKAAESKINSFSYTGMTGDGKYTFKIVPVGGDTQGTAIESAEVSYQKPLAQSTITANGSASKISVNWTAVDGATSYDLYRTLGSNGSAELITTTAGLTYEDTNVKTEEPYCYYVVAKNDNNESNPSVKVQTLASDGHVGEYVVENEAAKLTVTDKSNDTIASDSASITMKSDRAGSVKLVLNGKEVSTQSVKADEEFKLELSGLVQARNDVEVLFTDENNQTTRKTFNFVSKPKYDIVVDAAFAGNDGDVVDGHATYKTVQAAVNSVPADNAESKVIFIKNGEYNERVTVEVPNVSLLGEDAEKTHIYYSAAISEGTATDMWTRNAMYVGSDADGFTAENLTVENSFAYTNGSDQQADALCIVADKTACVNVRLVGYQDTLLTDSRVKGADGNYEVTRQYFSKCYITGNVDFIYGSGSSYFDDCDIVARYTPYKSDGCYTAPRTYASTDYGMVFNECRFTAEEGVGDGQYRLSRPWGADASTTFINCYIGRAVQSVGYGDMSGNLYKDARFAEYGSYGPGYYVNNDRPLLTSDEAKLFAEEKVMEDYDAEAVVKALYKADDSSTPDNPKPEDPKPADPTPGTPSDDKPADNTQVKDDNKAPRTGDKAPLAALASLLGLSGLGLFASTKKKRV